LVIYFDNAATSFPKPEVVYDAVDYYLAEKLGITMVGFIRGKRMNVYTGGWRIIQ